ncbi:pH-response regulator protein palI/RIM9 [Aspergillus udagawae]|nr:pH-response regulator protein palI/RIM9 [Aspergillus udagawae]
MLLKPATPLTILLLAAFVLLLLSVLSTPIIQGIPLATFNDVDYGVFGFCKAGQCTNIHIGYTTDEISNTDNSEFNLPSSTRRSLSSILIVHPVAAFLTLVCLCLAAAAHLHAPSHSPRYLLALLILLLPTLLVSLLAFLVDILLFVPHLGWGGWIVLGATILLVISGVVTCAMRRTLVSRKARKRRIAENAEMSGENYYNRQNAAAAAVASGFTGPRSEALNAETKEAIVTTSPNSDSGPMFATFRTTTHSSDDDRTPLNSQVAPIDIPPPDSQYPARGRGDGMPSTAPLDESRNHPYAGSYGPGPRMRPGPGDPRLRPQYSDGSMGSRRGPPPPGFAPRGRGGYPPRGGYGRGGPYGGPRGPPPNGRGGPMGPMRGAPSGMMGRGQRGPNAAGYGYGPVSGGLNPGYEPYNYGPGPRPSQRPGEDGFDYRGPSPVGAARQPSPGPIGMAVSSPETAPIGQAIELTSQPRHTDSAVELGPDAVSEEELPHAVSSDGRPEPLSPSSLYSRSASYIPPRAGWTPADLRVGPSPSPVHALDHPAAHARSNSGDNYYEDVDPRFAESHQPPAASRALPSALTSGAGEPKPMDDLAEAPGSPTTSEISHFTSISERPINPRWRPPPPPALPAQQRQNVLLENNPDFDLRAGGIGRAGATGVGGRMPPMSIPREPSRYPLP